MKLGDEQFAVADDWEAARPARAGRHRRRARPVRRLRPLRRRRTVRRDRRDRRTRRREPRRRRLRLRAVVLHLDHHRGVPEPAGDLGGRPRLVHHRRRSASRRCSTSPRASARSSASTSSTRRCCSIPRWVEARRVTFKYGLGDEFIDVLKTLHKLGLDRTDRSRVGGRRRVAARRGGRLPARPGDARRPHARQDLRGHVGDGPRQGRAARARSTSTTWSTTSGP